MRSSCLALIVIALSGTMQAQYRGGPNTSTSLGGFGNVLYPGTGGPPVGRTGGNINFPGQLGATIQGRPYGGGPYRQPQMVRQGHNRTVVVPYAVPVVVAGAPTDDYLPAQPQQQFVQQPAPTVIINQNFTPEMLHPTVREYPESPQMTSGPSGSMRSYEAPVGTGDRSVQRVEPSATAAQRTLDANRPTIYQIAFKNGATYSTVAYWVDGDTLNYVTSNGSVNRASLDLIDREVSEQLNRERNVEFQLPH